MSIVPGPEQMPGHHGLARGTSSPLGATPGPDGANFSVFARHATGVELLLFERADDPRASRTIRLDPVANRTYHYWHVFVPGVRPGQIYGYRVEGPFDPAAGMRFDPTKVLLDPYGRATAIPTTYSRDAARQKGDNTAAAMKSVLVDTSAYDWEGRHAIAATLLADHRVRDARAGIHATSQLGRGRDGTRDLRRGDREDPVSATTGYHRRRVATGVPV